MSETEESRELREVRREAAAWLRANVPAQPGFRLPQTFMEVEDRRQMDFLRAWQRKVYEAGYLGMAWPTKYGGYGRPPSHQDVVTQEMARARVPFMVNVIGLFWAGPTILKLGSEGQRMRYVKNILSAEEIWCQGFSEPENGSDLGNAQTRARREGDQYVVNGHKIWTTQAEFANQMILLARTNPDAPNKYAGLSFFLAPMDVPGVQVNRIRKMTGEYGFNEVLFRDARIPASVRVGEEGEGWGVAMAVLMFERGASEGQAGGSGMSVLTTRDVLETARKACRDGRPALDDPYVRDRLVQLMIEERAIPLNRRRARIHKLLTPGRELAPMLMSKLMASEYMRRLSDFAVNLQGANGALYMGDPGAIDNGVWQRAQMNSYSATIGGGTSEIQRNIIGERVLGLPKG